ncbi:hypothetical protein BG011_005701 [Mortierella polycephala]|uniref:DUF7082 domain-containing protein n=1 Tax=Mortierella polycephala TaxID=41804 RepID=A0A9P6UBD2_9FUNG|nr:hypothetical protein BG011_005701 [Mortierella polycephala]
MPELQQQQQLQQSMAHMKTEPFQLQAPRVLEYNPRFGPEGQTFTVTLQLPADRMLRIGFGTLVVDTKQYAANGYVTLSCIVPNFAITKWFVNKVPLYVLQMENDAVLESWPFGDYTYYDEIQSANSPTGTRRLSNDNKMVYGQNMNQNVKKQPFVADLDISHAQLSHHQQTQQTSPMSATTTTSLISGLSPRHDDYSSFSNTTTSATSSDASSGIYSQFQQQQVTSPYAARPAMTSQSYAPRSGYYNTNQMITPQLSPSYSQPDLTSTSYTMASTVSHNNNTNASNNNGYIHNHHSQAVTQSSYMPQTHPGPGMAIGNYNPYTSMLNKANLKFTGDMDGMALNWNTEEWESHRRLVQFWRRQDGNDIHCNFGPVAPAARQPNSIVVSCIYWAEKNDCFLTSVDCIYLLESLIAVRFTVEEKNRIRRNLEGFRPITVSKCKPESAEFFKLIMSFPNPKPRNIEKDVKVFPWKVLSYALKKIISKYTASYSTSNSIQTDAFHNANFPHGSTLPLTPQQQNIIESSLIV